MFVRKSSLSFSFLLMLSLGLGLTKGVGKNFFHPPVQWFSSWVGEDFAIQGTLSNVCRGFSLSQLGWGALGN